MQYQVIFRLADYVRRYQWRQSQFNKHQKYKHLRPVFGVLTKDEVIEKECGKLTELSFLAIQQMQPEVQPAQELYSDDETEVDNFEDAIDHSLRLSPQTDNSGMTREEFKQQGYDTIREHRQQLQ